MDTSPSNYSLLAYLLFPLSAVFIGPAPTRTDAPCVVSGGLGTVRDEPLLSREYDGNEVDGAAKVESKNRAAILRSCLRQRLLLERWAHLHRPVLPGRSCRCERSCQL